MPIRLSTFHGNKQVSLLYLSRIDIDTCDVDLLITDDAKWFDVFK